MLQNNPVRNLQYDSDLRIAQICRPEPTVYGEPVNIIVNRRATQAPLPISTVGHSSTLRRDGVVGLYGLEVLHDMPSVHIEQSFELNENLTSIASENRYIIRSPLGDAIYLSNEISEQKDRNLWGAARPCRLSLLDRTHQEVLSFQKNFTGRFLCCNAKVLEVWIAPGNFIGKIQEESFFFSSKLRIQSDTDTTLYCIEGVRAVGCSPPNEAHFNVFSADGGTLKGSITRKWSTTVSQHTLNIYFNDVNCDVNSKALFVGAAFLMEYLYFQ